MVLPTGLLSLMIVVAVLGVVLLIGLLFDWHQCGDVLSGLMAITLPLFIILAGVMFIWFVIFISPEVVADLNQHGLKGAVDYLWNGTNK